MLISDYCFPPTLKKISLPEKNTITNPLPPPPLPQQNQDKHTQKAYKVSFAGDSFFHTLLAQRRACRKMFLQENDLA